MSQLLERASADDEDVFAPRHEPSSQQPGAGLNSLATDIAKLVDHHQAAIAWDRYYSGEADVFSISLYTGRGQRTFAEIREKYRGDMNFRGAVDRYLENFEKLLQDVSGNGQNPDQARNTLLTDTGKVYTMLLHASGRVGG